MANLYNMSYDDLVAKYTNDQKKQIADEINKMRAMALNGRPRGADGVSIAGGSLISAGAEIAAQQAYDRNMAAVNNPQAMLNLLTKGEANVGAPKMHMGKHSRGDYSLDTVKADLDLEQLERDTDMGLVPTEKQLLDAGLSGKKITRSGALAEGVLQKGLSSLGARRSLLGTPWPTETPQYDVPSYETPEPKQGFQDYGGDVRPIKPMTYKIGRDKKSLIPYFTNF